jgi:hypothetical protein
MKVDLDREYAKLFRNIPGLDHIFQNPHDETQAFTFQQMLQYLISTSIKLYKKEKDLSIHESGVAACFNHLLKNLVVPYAKGLYYRIKSDTQLEFLKKIYRVSLKLTDIRTQNYHICQV